MNITPGQVKRVLMTASTVGSGKINDPYRHNYHFLDEDSLKQIHVWDPYSATPTDAELLASGSYSDNHLDGMETK